MSEEGQGSDRMEEVEGRRKEHGAKRYLLWQSSGWQELMKWR